MLLFTQPMELLATVAGWGSAHCPSGCSQPLRPQPVPSQTLLCPRAAPGTFLCLISQVSCLTVLPACSGPSGWDLTLKTINGFPPNLVSSTHLRSVHSVIHYRSLIKVLSRRGPCTGPCSCPVVTDILEEHNPLTMTLWVWPSNHFFYPLYAHLAITSELGYTSIVGDGVENLVKTEVNDTYCSSAIPVFWLEEWNLHGTVTYT